MQLSELLTHTRSLLNEPTALVGQRLFTDTELTRFLNFGYSDFVNKAMPCENVFAYAAVAKQTRYPKPTGALLVESVLWEERYEIECKDVKEFRAYMYLSPTVRGTIPMMYCEYPGFSNPELQLWPVPGSAAQATTLSAGVGASDTTIPVASTTNFPTSGWIIIDNEQIWYNDTDATNFKQCERGKGGTTAAAHLSAAAVKWGNLTVRYTFMPALLSSASDEPKFPAAWHEALTLYAAKLGFEKMGKLPEAQIMLGQYEAFITRANNIRESRNLDRPFGWSGWDINNNPY